ncbi:MAG: ATP-binding cassette domain-containing protein [Clostridiales bacterium]|nr:ATP-binding cassette domain-containing protein [Clostridiales bacterium]
MQDQENTVVTSDENSSANGSQFILEVKNLKKYFVAKKEWKILKTPVETKDESLVTIPSAEQTETAENGEQTETIDNAEVPAQTDELKAEAEVTPEDGENEKKTAEQKPKYKYKLARQITYVKAVNGVSFTMYPGETLGIVGESGCGKSTMGRSILRLHDITDGQVFFDGTDITKLKPNEMRKFRTKMQIIFQDPYSSLPPRSPVGDIIGEAVKVHKIVPKNEQRDYVIEIMRKCGLQDFYFDRYPHEFSGGQRQRICIARALAVKPKFVVCDEPVSALDVSIQAQVINLLKELQRDMNLTYLFISHDLSVVQHISDRVGVMYLGNFVELGNEKEIFNNPMHPYTHALLSAVPVPDPHYKGNRIILSGDIPSPAHPPEGCKFHTRCSRCMEVCKHVEPKFKDYGNGHFCACHLYPQD